MLKQFKDIQVSDIISVPAIELPREMDIVRRAVIRLDRKKAARYALISAGVFCGLKLIHSVRRNLTCRSIAAREVKKQLAPIYEKLDTLSAENQALKAQNELLQAQIAGANPAGAEKAATD